MRVQMAIMIYMQNYPLKWNLFMKSLTSNMSLKFFLTDLEDNKGETIEVEVDLMAIIETTRAKINLLVIQGVARNQSYGNTGGARNRFGNNSNSRQINRKNPVDSSGIPQGMQSVSQCTFGQETVQI